MNCERMGARKIKMGPRIKTCGYRSERICGAMGTETLRCAEDELGIVVCNTGTYLEKT